MSLEKSAQKNHLESEYERYRSQAERARAEGNAQKAARYYRQCVEVLRDIAELESSDRLTQERIELAKNLQTAAERLENDQPLTDDGADGGSSTKGDSGKGVGGDKSGRSDGESSSSNSKGGDGEDVTPSEYLEDPPELDFSDVGGMTDLKETLKDQVIEPVRKTSPDDVIKP